MKWILDRLRRKGYKRFKIDHVIPGKRVPYDRIERVIERIANAEGRDFCLDFGAGNLHDDRFTSIDIDADCEPDIVLDIRTLFAGSDVYRDMLEDYPDADKIDGGYFLIRMLHTIEHIEWIYVRAMFQWLYTIIAPEGRLFLATPNVEYVAKLYVENMLRLENGQSPAFPRDEHPDFKDGGKGYDVTRWLNFKTYSGCSWQDWHHCMFDRYWLLNLLSEVGFDDILYVDGNTLYVLATKPSDLSAHGTDSSVQNVIDQWQDREAGK